MDDTAEKTINAVSKSADEEFSMEIFKDAVRYLEYIYFSVKTFQTRGWLSFESPLPSFSHP